MRQNSEDQDRRNIKMVHPNLPHRRPSGVQRKRKISGTMKAGFFLIVAWTMIGINFLFYENLPNYSLIITGILGMVSIFIFLIIFFEGDSEYREAQAQKWKEENQKADEEQNREHRRLMNIAGAEDTWSCDDILIRLRELQRYQKRYYPFRTQFQKAAQDSENPEAALAGFLHGFAPADPRADELSDTIFRLERIAKRRNCHDDNAASPDTIIGFERD